VAAPVVAIELLAPADRGTGAVVHQDPVRGGVFELVCVRLEFVEDRIEQGRVERVAGLQPVTPDAVGLQLATTCSRSFAGPDNTVLRVVGGNRQAGNSSANPSTRSAPAKIATIRPPAGKLAKRRPRSAISFAPSSMLNTPATHAAEYWPTLWPSTTAGSKPRTAKAAPSHLHREQGRLRVRGLPQRFLTLGALSIENDVQ